jgi:hypothetical protein
LVAAGLAAAAGGAEHEPSHRAKQKNQSLHA